ncbi:MAG TPA: hypothetical protein VGK54_13785 [Chloroflexota bacterium]|jgi:hypothetical protein
MPHPNDSELFASDLEKLLRVARIKLPEMAEVYLDANHKIARTGDADTTAFTVQSRVLPSWRALRDEFQRVLGQTADNIIDTARVLERVVDHYARTDAEAAAALKKAVGDSESEMRTPGSARLAPSEMPKE